MHIPKEYLSEVNYTGSRLIEVDDSNVIEYKKLLRELQEEANPILDLMEELDKKVEPYRQQVKVLKDENQVDWETIKPIKEQYEILARALPEDATDSTPEMKELEVQMDPVIDRIKKREAEIHEIREELKPHKDAWDAEHIKVQEIDKRAAVIKEKMIPFVNKFLDGKLEEFEEAKHLVDNEDKIYAEVFDQLEEFIKTYRSKHA